MNIKLEDNKEFNKNEISINYKFSEDKTYIASEKNRINSKIKKGIFSIIFFILLVFLTFYIIFKNNDITRIFEIIKNVDMKFIAIAILCMSVFVLSEGINIRRTLKLLECKVTFWQAIKYAFVGFFFSSITPSASGGDPMQIYYMSKDKLSIGKSTLAIFTEFSSFQIVTILMAIIGLISSYGFIEESIGNIKYLMLIGVLINTLILSVIILSCFPNRIINKLVDIVVKILNKFHYKKTQEFKDKCLYQINEYQNGARLIKSNKKVFIKIFCTTLVQIVLYHSIPYFIYLSFGLSGASYLRFLALQAVLYISVSSIPLPGAVGISEGGFMIIYDLLFPAEMLGSAMLLSRGVSFYLFVVVTGIGLLFFSIFNRRKKLKINNNMI